MIAVPQQWLARFHRCRDLYRPSPQMTQSADVHGTIRGMRPYVDQLLAMVGD